MSRRYNESMVDGGKYMARVSGIINCGLQPNMFQYWNNKEYSSRHEFIVTFEILDEEFCIAHGRPLVMVKAMEISQHELSQMARLARAVGIIKEVRVPCTVETDDGELLESFVSYPSFDTDDLTYGLVELTVRKSRNTGQFCISNISKPTEMAHVMYRDAPVKTPYIYDIHTDTLVCGNMKDVPEKLIEGLILREER